MGVSSDLTQIGAAIARIPSGCSILTVTDVHRSTGVLVSWVQQCSFAPPAVTVCLREGRPAAPLVESSGRFLLNVIGDNSKAMFRHFGRGFALEEDAFGGLAVGHSEFGPLIPSCPTHLGCRVMQSLIVGDHRLFVAEVVWGQVTSESPPYTHLRKNGLSY